MQEGRLIGKGFLGMLVFSCEKCKNIVHMKPFLGTLHICKK